MTDLDDADQAILDELQRNGRATYQAIAEEVGLSGPAVSTRIDRLKDTGVIRGFSVDIDRGALADTDLNHVIIQPSLSEAAAVAGELADVDAVEAVYPLVDGRLAMLVWAPAAELSDVLLDALPSDDIQIQTATTVSNPNR